MPLIPPSFAKDFRHTLRSLWRDKAFSTTVLATCALCLGANIVIFAVVHAILFAPLPYEHPEQLVLPDNSYTKIGLEHVGASVPNYFEWREGVPAFAEVGAYDVKNGLIGEPGSPERVTTVYATPGFFRVLGVKPELGRLFLEEEGSYGGKGHWNVAVLSDAFWRQHYAADPGVIGKTMKVEGGDRYIVGVLPPGFRFLSTEAQIYVTMVMNDKDRGPANRHWSSTSIIARLKPGTTPEQAQAQIDGLNLKIAATDPGAGWAKGAGFRTTVRGLHAAHVEKVRDALLLLEGAALLLLGVGCVNMLNLLLVRASTRAKDMSVRQVLGASRLNIFARLLTETTALALLGTALGVALAAVSLRFIDRLGVAELPLGASVRMDASVLAMSAAAAVVLALVLAAPLIAFSSGLELAPALASESRSGTTTRGRHRFRHSLVVAQIALAFVLLTGAGLLGLSFRRMLAVDPGFNPDSVVTAWVGVPWASYKEKGQRNAFADRWLQSVRSLPGVGAVGLGTFVPVEGDRGTISMIVEGREPGAGEAAKAHNDALVAGDYFSALGIPLREGRLLDDSDTSAAKKVCVIDEDFARQYWPTQSPLGYRISVGGGPIDADSVRIVGVVGSVKHGSLSERDPRGIVYIPMAVYGAPFRMATIVRSTLPSSIVVPEMRKALLGIDPLLPLDGVATMDAAINGSLIFPRSLLFTAALFGAMALLLSAVGVYGIMAYSVSQREREIGIRMALGAQPLQILAQFMGQGGKLLLIGLVVGSAASLAAGRLVASLLFDVSPGNVAVYAAAVAMLSGVVMAATLLPSRRASAISAMEALRRD